ncbi:MAG: hypothetical protein ACQESR_11215 [Planctomycetota bacterium]
MKTSRIVTRVTSFTASVLACVGAAWAQPVSGRASSVEWAAANSHLIVRALIDDVSVHALKDGLHPDDGRHRYQTVSVRVLETIQGEHSGRLRFVQNGNFGPVRLSDLHKKQQEVSDNQDLRWLAARAMVYFKSVNCRFDRLKRIDFPRPAHVQRGPTRAGHPSPRSERNAILIGIAIPIPIWISIWARIGPSAARMSLFVARKHVR